MFVLLCIGNINKVFYIIFSQGLWYNFFMTAVICTLSFWKLSLQGKTAIGSSNISDHCKGVLKSQWRLKKDVHEKRIHRPGSQK